MVRNIELELDEWIDWRSFQFAHFVSCRYTDPYNEDKQSVKLVNAVLGVKDGIEKFVMHQRDQESHILKTGEYSIMLDGLIIIL